ncbi:MAG TPA: hypothetical protein VHQ00_02435 [Chloroflexota bacterium]|nr:hypothetical protein [Chloroflexota bacterium]
MHDEGGARLDPVTRARYARRAVARLQARWGEGAVVRPACVPARLPERRVRHLPPELGLQLAPPGPPGPEDAEDVDAPLLEQAPLWLVDPPREVQVVTTKRRGERPRLNGWPRPRQSRRIVRWGGPWRVVDASVLAAVLATGRPLKRDYYQIELEDGGAYLVYWDRVSDDWFLQGVFD